LYGAFFVKKFQQEVSAERPIFLPSSVSLFDMKARFFVSDQKPSRPGAVNWLAPLLRGFLFDETYTVAVLAAIETSRERKPARLICLKAASSGSGRVLCALERPYARRARLSLELAGTYSREINCGHAEGENDDDGTEDAEDTAFRLNASHGLNICEIPQSAKDKRAITLCASTPIARAFSLPSSLDGNDRARSAAHCKQRPQARLTG
jgi:hypothetical protein